MLPNILMTKSMSQIQKAWTLLTTPGSQNARLRQDTIRNCRHVGQAPLSKHQVKSRGRNSFICKVGWNLSYERSRAGLRHRLHGSRWGYFLIAGVLVGLVGYSVSLSQVANRVLCISVFRKLCKSPQMVPVTVFRLEMKISKSAMRGILSFWDCDI